jgi:hypothetical protein
MMEAIHSSKLRFLQEPQGTISQKIAFFIVTAVRTSNLANFSFIRIKNLIFYIQIFITKFTRTQEDNSSIQHPTVSLENAFSYYLHICA